MRSIFFMLVISVLLIPQAGVLAVLLDPTVQSPQPGQVLQGRVSIQGNTDVDNFISYDVSFAYQNNPLDTWFILQESDQRVKNGVLAIWDTSTITDGDYNLRLTVLLTNGKSQQVLVKGLRVRNYQAVETDTPGALSTGGETSTPTLAPTPTKLMPSPTALSTNPAELTDRNIISSLQWGGIAAIILFSLLGLGLGLRKIFR